MTIAVQNRFTANGHDLDTSPEAFGTLRDSGDLAGDAGALRARMEEDGYLFLPGYLDRAAVLAARGVITDRLGAQGLLDPERPAQEAVARPGVALHFKPDLAEQNPALMAVLYDGPMMAFWRRFFGEPVRHFDYTWMRAVAPGRGTAPHCDSVYMGRGTKKLHTAWTPLGDISYELGGLMILENSHKNERLKANYGSRDVDTHCTNHNNIRATGSSAFGALTQNPARIRERLGGRWLTHAFRAGDLLVFSIFTVHASLDNHSDRIRLSSDTRYQPASEPADERWILGPNGQPPIAHGPDAKRGMIC